MKAVLGVSWFRLDALNVGGMPRMIVGLVKIRSNRITANEEYALAA